MSTPLQKTGKNNFIFPENVYAPLNDAGDMHGLIFYPIVVWMNYPTLYTGLDFRYVRLCDIDIPAEE